MTTGQTDHDHPPGIAAHDAGVCECNAVVWDLVIDETRTIRRYRVWQCRFCKRLREREDAA